MPKFTITKNPYGSNSSKIIETDLPDDVMVEVLNGYVSLGKHKDGTWRATLNKSEERSISDKLENTCAEIARQSAVAQTKAVVETENVVSLHTMPRRFIVEAGKYQVGNLLGSRVITKLGKEWKIDSEETSAHGLGPWIEWVQYAYFD
jgi:hypothetical protein